MVRSYFDDPIFWDILLKISSVPNKEPGGTIINDKKIIVQLLSKSTCLIIIKMCTNRI